MSKCSACRQEMLDAPSCIKVRVQIKSGKKIVKTMDPIPFGREQRFDGEGPNADRCHDCNVKRGGFHHPGCDWEECPNCHRQMLMCGGECGQ